MYSSSMPYMNGTGGGTLTSTGAGTVLSTGGTVPSTRYRGAGAPHSTSSIPNPTQELKTGPQSNWKRTASEDITKDQDVPTGRGEVNSVWRRIETIKPANLPQVNPPPVSPGYTSMAPPPTLSPGFTMAAPPPPSPSYNVPPPYHHNLPQQHQHQRPPSAFNVVTGRHSPSGELLSAAGHHQYSSGSPKPTSPNMLHPPPRSPNLVYQPPSPSLSYFSSHSGSRQRTLIEVPRIDTEAPPLPNVTNRNPENVNIHPVRVDDKARRLLSSGFQPINHNYNNANMTAINGPMSAPPYREVYEAGVGGGIAPPKVAPGYSAVHQAGDHHAFQYGHPVIAVVPPSSANVNITKSRLDPNVRPFTPSNKMFSNFNSYGGCGETIETSSCQTFESETQSHTDELEDGVQFTFEQEYDPLPQDPGALLPDLDTTVEDLNNNNSTMENKNIKSTKDNNNNTSTNCNEEKKLNEENRARSERRMQAPSPLLHDAKWKSEDSPVKKTVLLPSNANQRMHQVQNNQELRRENFEPESRNLVSGLEQSLHSWMANQQLQMLQQQASFIEKIKKRMAAGYPRGAHAVDMSQQQAGKVNTGGIFTQDMATPPEYMMSHIIGDRIRPINIRQEHTDLLFFIFYTMQGDALQLVAASLLFERGWRYHKQQRIWLARWPGVRPEEKTASFERGLYQYFDLANWKRIPGWFRLDYCHLAEKTGVPEDLKTLYTKYSGLLQNINSACSKLIALHGFNAKGSEVLNEIEGIKYMSCIM